MKNIAIKSLYVAGWFTLLSVVMFWESSSDRVHLIFAWMSSETMVMVGFAMHPFSHYLSATCYVVWTPYHGVIQH